jgi:asparagine synthase (glutamine-hydrolysing)
MRLNDNGPMITFNGVIYNFRELRYELTARKVVLRNSQRDRLPAEILDGPKTGFGVPYENWLCTSLYDFACAHLLDARFLDCFALNGKAIKDMLVLHRNRKIYRGFMLWKLLQMALLVDAQDNFK